MEKKKRNFLVVSIVVIILVIIILMFGCSNKDKSNSSAGKSVPTEYVSENEQNNEISTSGTSNQEQDTRDPEDGNVIAGNQILTNTPTPVVTKSAEQSEAVTPTKGATVTKSASGATKTSTPTVNSSSGTVTKAPTPTKADSQSAGITKAATPVPTKAPAKLTTATPVPTKTSSIAQTKEPTKVPTATPTKKPTNTPKPTATKKPTVTPTPHIVEYITEITEVERTFTTANTISRDGTITLWHFEHDTAPDYPYITSHVPGATAKNIQLDLDAGYSMSGVFVACCSMIGESYGGKTTRITAMSPVELAIGAKYSDGTVKYYSEDECFVLEFLVCDICGKQHK